MEWIDELVVGTIEFYGTNNPFDILNAMGIMIVKLDKDEHLLLGRNCVYIMELNTIYIRNDLLHKHEIFYLGHEIGHIVLHYDEGQDYISIRIPNDGKTERQANYFALKLEQITFDEIELYEMTIEQIACTLELPVEPLKQLANL